MYGSIHCTCKFEGAKAKASPGRAKALETHVTAAKKKRQAREKQAQSKQDKLDAKVASSFEGLHAASSRVDIGDVLLPENMFSCQR